MRERVKVGKAPPADLLREEAELSKARAELNERYRDYNIALIRLKTAQGISLASVISLSDSLEQAAQAADLNYYLQEAKKNNPAVLIATAKLGETRARRGVAVSRYAPQLGLYGLASNASGNAAGEDNSVNGKWGGTLGIIGGVTLFDSGLRRAELSSASALVRQAEYDLQQANLNAAEAVATSWVELEVARRNYDLAQSEVTSAQEDHRLMHARYLVGKAIALEDFDASVRLYQARLRLLERRFAEKIALARLQNASGII
jgi:outer membrane protein TolC